MARLPKELNDQIFQRLKSIVEVERMTLDERLAYETSLSEIRDLHNIADSHYEKGLEEGREEGREEGEKIRQQSIRDIASALKKKGAELSLIQEVTGLSPEEIAEL